MRISAESILKPGVKLGALKINWQSPEVQKQINAVRAHQRAILRHKEVSPETLHLIINI
jgi:hypothetical protein